MIPFVSDDARISKVTIGSLEDLGYTVDYNAADSFTANDFGSSCRCRRRLTGDTDDLSEGQFLGDGINPETSPHHRRQLSDAGREHAEAMGRSYLESLPQPSLGVVPDVEHDDGQEYRIEGDLVYVYYEEDGVVYHVDVGR